MAIKGSTPMQHTHVAHPCSTPITVYPIVLDSPYVQCQISHYIQNIKGQRSAVESSSSKKASVVVVFFVFFVGGGDTLSSC